MKTSNDFPTSENLFKLVKQAGLHGSTLVHPNIVVDELGDVLRVFTNLPPQFVFDAHQDPSGRVYVYRYRPGKWESVLERALEKRIQKKRNRKAYIDTNKFSPAKWWWS